MSNKYFDEDFGAFESRVDRVMKILEEMNTNQVDDSSKGNKSQTETPELLVDRTGHLDNIDEDNFIVKVRENRSCINKKADDNPNDSPEMDKFTFMQQLEDDAAKRTAVRQEREKIAQNFRSLGNNAFRNQQYEKAINMYTKAIEHVKDSPILYNNRALSYIKLKVYRRAIIDCDYVLNKLDEKNLRAMLYRAGAYHRLNDEKNFETSIKLAKKNHSKEIEIIDKFLEKLKNDNF